MFNTPKKSEDLFFFSFSFDMSDLIDQPKPVLPLRARRKRLLYPWGTYTVPKEEHPGDDDYYDELHTYLQNKVQLNVLSLMFLDLVESRCVDYMTVFSADVNYVWESDEPNHLFEECMATTTPEQIPIIPIILTQVQLPDMLDALVLNYHANAILIDRITKTVERFEPDQSDDSVEDTDPELDKGLAEFFRARLGDSFKYSGPVEFCPNQGPQNITEDSLCWAWSMLYMHLRILNPKLSRSEIVSILNYQTRKSRRPVRVWMDMISNSLKEWQSKGSIYTEEQRTSLTALQKRFRDTAPPPEQIAYQLIKAAKLGRQPLGYWLYQLVHGKAKIKDVNWTIKAVDGKLSIKSTWPRGQKNDYKELIPMR